MPSHYFYRRSSFPKFHSLFSGNLRLDLFRCKEMSEESLKVK